MSRPMERLRLALALALLAGALPSCAPQARSPAPPVDVPGAFSRTGAQAAPDRWWLALDDPQLGALVDQALAGNMDLRVLWDRLDQAAASARREGAAFWPSATGDATATRTRWKTRDEQPTYATAIVLGVAAAYEVDLWGRIRATVAASDLETRATREDLEAGAMTLTASVASTWYQIVAQREQVALLEAQIDTNEKYLDLVAQRFRHGKVTAIDVLQQRQLVEATRAEKVLAESRLRVLEHQLAILVGRAPQAPVALAGGRLPALPHLPATGLPADLVRKRPDIRSAYLRLQEADQHVAAAVADLFPRLSLGAGAETSSEQLRDLLDNWLATLAANVLAPLLDGGQRDAEIRRTRAVASERLHAYGQAVLLALGEAENALVQERQQQLYLTSVEQQLDLAAKATEQTRQQYVQGSPDYLRVLDALQSQQQLQLQRLQAQRDLIGFRIDLYRALGGGWELARPSNTPEAAARP